MAQGILGINVTIGGLNLVSRAQRTGSVQITAEMTAALSKEVKAGQAGTLTTRTDDDTGVATLGAGHGITTDDLVDVHWDGGARYRMTVTNVDGTAVTIDQGSGDVLPSQDTVLTAVSPRRVADVDFDGDDLQMIVAVANKACRVEFLKDDGTLIKGLDLVANEAWPWVKDQGVTNPFTGDPVGLIEAANKTTETAEATVVALVEPTT